MRLQVGAKNQRRLVAVYLGRDSGFEVVHGFLNRIMDMLNVPQKGTNAALEAKIGGGYVSLLLCMRMHES